MNCPRCDRPAETEDLRLYGGVCPRCVLDFAAEQDAPSFPGIEILGLLGEGGMGVVYKARQTALDRVVALKVLSPRLSGDPEFAARFTREAKALAQLGHPNIVSIHESGIHDGVPYLVMEYVEGTSLRALLAGRKLAPERALAIVPQICDALHYAHARGVVHRDIKPENILIDRQGRVKIADFGLAKVGGEATRVTRSSAMMGTPNYMAPEQVENTAGVDHRADIYSLGVVFYEMLTGELPLGRFKAPSEKAAVDARLDPVVLRSLEKEPAARYQQASEVKGDLSRVREGRPVRAGRHLLASLATSILALADLLFVLWLSISPAPPATKVVWVLVAVVVMAAVVFAWVRRERTKTRSILLAAGLLLLAAWVAVVVIALYVRSEPPGRLVQPPPLSFGAIRQWELDLGGPQLGLVSVGDRVFAASTAGLVEIDPVRGERLGGWKGTISAPPTAHGEWMIVRNPDRLVVFRPGEGPLEPWHTLDLPGAADPTIAHDVAYLGTAGGRALALDLEARKVLWDRETVGFPVSSGPALLPDEVVFFGGRRNHALQRSNGNTTGSDRSSRAHGETPAFRAGAFRLDSGWAVLAQTKDSTLLGTFRPGVREWGSLPSALEPGPLELAEIEDCILIRSSWGVRAWRPGTDTWFTAVEGALAAPVPAGRELAALPTRDGLRLLELHSGRVLRTAFPDSWEEAVFLPHQGSLLILDRMSGSLKSIRLSGSRVPDPPGDTLSLVYSEKPYWPINPPPAGVRALSSTEGEEALRRARLPAGMMKDLVRARRVTLGPGSVEHVELAFRSELTLRRWFQDPGMAKRFPDPGEAAIGARVEILSVPAGAKATGVVLQPRKR